MKITDKEIQHHQECVCGANVVSHETLRISEKNLKIVGIKKKKDKRTNTYFYQRHTFNKVCNCNDLDY
jgi:hypothetical protein